MPNSIGGMASGLNTSDIINAILTGEQATRSRLVSRQGTYQRQLSVWQDINTKLTALTTAADTLSSPAKATASTASSTDEDLVVASASSTATPATFTFRVQQLATAHQRMANGFASTADLVGAGKAKVAAGLPGVGLTMTNASGLVGGKYEIEVKSIAGGTATVIFAGKTQTVSSTGSISLNDGNGRSATFNIGTLKVGKAAVGIVDTTAATTLEGLSGAINSLGIGVSAAAVNKNDGTATPASFVLSARDAGTANSLTLDFSGLSGVSGKTFADLRTATDAKLLLADGVTSITRSTNRLTDVIPGVTLDLQAADPSKDVTVTVAHDDQKMVDAAKSMVDAMNAVMSAIKKSTSYDAATKTSATLTGDSRIRRVSDSLLAAMRYADSAQDKKSLSQVGITLGRDGTYAFDETKFRAALTSDYSGAVRLLAGDGAGRKGVVGTLTEAVKGMQAANGTVEGAVGAAKTNIAGLNGRIAAEDRRLALVEERVRRQYTNLETSLSQLKAQASGLSSALG